MTAQAVIIGIDDYANEPLTSAVSDALAFRQALIDLGLVPGERGCAANVTTSAKRTTRG